MGTAGASIYNRLVPKPAHLRPLLAFFQLPGVVTAFIAYAKQTASGKDQPWPAAVSVSALSPRALTVLTDTAHPLPGHAISLGHHPTSQSMDTLPLPGKQALPPTASGVGVDDAVVSNAPAAAINWTIQGEAEARREAAVGERTATTVELPTPGSGGQTSVAPVTSAGEGNRLWRVHGGETAIDLTLGGGCGGIRADLIAPGDSHGAAIVGKSRVAGRGAKVNNKRTSRGSIDDESQEQQATAAVAIQIAYARAARLKEEEVRDIQRRARRIIYK